MQRDAYIRHVSSTEGLTALASAVVRNASSVLKASGGVRGGFCQEALVARKQGWASRVARDTNLHLLPSWFFLLHICCTLQDISEGDTTFTSLPLLAVQLLHALLSKLAAHCRTFPRATTLLSASS